MAENITVCFEVGSNDELVRQSIEYVHMARGGDETKAEAQFPRFAAHLRRCHLCRATTDSIIAEMIEEDAWLELQGEPYHSAAECNDALCSDHGDPRDAIEASPAEQ